MSALVEPVSLTVPTRRASFAALSAHVPVIDVIGGRARAEQVERHHRELQRRAALQKQNLVVCRHFASARMSASAFCENAFEGRRSVADLHDRHADAGQRQQVALHLLEHGTGSTAGPEEKFRMRVTVVMGDLWLAG